MYRLICLLIGYLFGCIQSAFIIGRLVGKIDIRDYGSGNAGFTNTTRVLGAKTGIIVFICDILKLAAAYFICEKLFAGSIGSPYDVLPGIYAGAGTVLGHNFPFYMQFRGGKGIACTLALMLCIDWKVAVVVFAVGLLIVVVKKYISLASLVMSFIYPVIMLFLIHKGVFCKEAAAVMFALCILAFYKHRENIKRLIAGSENKFSFKKSK